MGHVAIPYTWNDFLYRRGCSYNVQSILRSGLIAGGRESKQGRQTVFFTPLNPLVPIQTKRNSTVIYPTRGRYTTKASGNRIRTQSIGSMKPEHKTKDCNFGRRVSRHNCMQLCANRLHLQSDLSKRREDFIRKTLHAPICAEDCTQKGIGDRSSSSSQIHWKVNFSRHRETVARRF